MANGEPTTLFLFLDESGNFDFSPRGSRYRSLTALCTMAPVLGRGSFLTLLYELASAGEGQEFFHAAEDNQSVRDKVFGCIGRLMDDCEIHCVIAEKSKANPALYKTAKVRKGKIVTSVEPYRFYERVCRTLLKYVFNRPRYRSADTIVVVLSSLFTRQFHGAIARLLRSYLKMETSAKFHIYFHCTKADLNCQIADYCGWAIARKWESGDTRSYNLISAKIRNEFNLFQWGQEFYY